MKHVKSTFLFKCIFWGFTCPKDKQGWWPTCPLIKTTCLGQVDTVFVAPWVLFYSCLEYLCVCVRSLLQSRFFCFFVCLFVSYWNFFFLLLLCFLTGLDHQGIFRLSGSTTEINDMKQLFENGNKTERSLLWEISLLLCHVLFTRKALTFTQTTYIYMKTFNPLVTVSEWRKKRIFHQFLFLGLFFG